MMIAYLKYPVKGETSYDLLNLRRISRLGQAFRGDRAGKGRDGLAGKTVVAGKKIVEERDRSAVTRVATDQLIPDGEDEGLT